MLLRIQRMVQEQFAMWVTNDYAMVLSQPVVTIGPTWRHDTMATPTPACVHPTPEELLPIFRECFTRATLQHWLRDSSPATTFYWRLFTPLILLWCLIFQRLNADHRGDAVLSHLHTG